MIRDIGGVNLPDFLGTAVAGEAAAPTVLIPLSQVVSAPEDKAGFKA